MFDLENQNQERKEKELELEHATLKREKETLLESLNMSEAELLAAMRDSSRFTEEELLFLKNLRQDMEETVQKNMGAKAKSGSIKDFNLPSYAIFCR